MPFIWVLPCFYQTNTFDFKNNRWFTDNWTWTVGSADYLPILRSCIIGLKWYYIVFPTPQSLENNGKACSSIWLDKVHAKASNELFAWWWRYQINNQTYKVEVNYDSQDNLPDCHFSSLKHHNFPRKTRSEAEAYSGDQI